jgi:nucleotide-binding universal stress UspA family protein
MLPIKRILCPVDFSEHSFRALRKAEELARHFDAELLVLHVVSPIPTARPTFEPEADFDVDAYEEGLRVSYQDELERAVEGQLSSDTDSRAVVAVGEPPSEILRAAESRDVDMIVLSTHGETGWRHLVFGSVAERVVRLAHCPVLTIRAWKPHDKQAQN